MKVAEDAAKAGEATEGGEGDSKAATSDAKPGDASATKPSVEVDEDLFGDDDLSLQTPIFNCLGLA